MTDQNQPRSTGQLVEDLIAYRDRVTTRADRDLLAEVGNHLAKLGIDQKPQHAESCDLDRAEALLNDPDAEDCERFASRYGRSLIATARNHAALQSAVEALGAMPEGYCFCSSNRIGDDSKTHEPECAELRVAMRTNPEAEHG